jgi:hypothetical protein
MYDEELHGKSIRTFLFSQNFRSTGQEVPSYDTVLTTLRFPG